MVFCRLFWHNMMIFLQNFGKHLFTWKMCEKRVKNGQKTAFYYIYLIFSKKGIDIRQKMCYIVIAHFIIFGISMPFLCLFNFRFTIAYTIARDFSINYCKER